MLNCSLIQCRLFPRSRVSVVERRSPLPCITRIFNRPLNDNAYQACYKQCSKLTLTIGHGRSLYERDLSMCCYSIYMLPRECTMPSAVACDFGKTLFLSKPRSPRSSKRTAYHSTYLVQSRVHGPRELSDREPPGQLNRRPKPTQYGNQVRVLQHFAQIPCGRSNAPPDCRD
jgi:hypothetical protein